MCTFTTVSKVRLLRCRLLASSWTFSVASLSFKQVSCHLRIHSNRTCVACLSYTIKYDDCCLSSFQRGLCLHPKILPTLRKEGSSCTCQNPSQKRAGTFSQQRMAYKRPWNLYFCTADQFAVDQGHAESLKEALLILDQKNRSSTNVDPWYSAYHHSHPPLVQRLGAIENAGKKTQ